MSLVLHEVGSAGAPLLFVAGPPCSGRLFREVQLRLAPRRSVAVELLDSGAPAEVPALAERLAALARDLGAEVVIAHGLAVPLLARLDVALRVITNGPVSHLDPVTAAIVRLPAPLLSRVLLRPAVMRRWMSSSLGLRRLVLNPYVMDHDTVATLLEPLITDPGSRAATAAWIQSLPSAISVGWSGGGEIAAIWGEDDRIYQISQVDLIKERGLLRALMVIPGGRHMHLEEQPWAFADALAALLDEREAPRRAAP